MFKLKNILKESKEVNKVNNYIFKRYLTKISPYFVYRNNANEFNTTIQNEIKIKHMNSSVLCIFSNMLLKENIKNDFIWKQVERRSYEIIDRFEVGEIASFLFCLSKARYETNLYDSFIPIIKRKFEYLNTSNLAMLISSYSKRKKEDLIILLKDELKKKVHTLYNIVEISMILNALVKCKIQDDELFIKLDNIIVDNVFHKHVHIRDICVISYCYASILYKNMNIFKILSQKIITLFDDANLVDICRILYTYIKIDQNYNHILKLSTLKLNVCMHKSSISEVINCIHFLPLLKDLIENDDCNNIKKRKDIEICKDKSMNYYIEYANLFNYILNVFNDKLTSYVNLLNANQISNIFYIYSRYNILISLQKFEIFISQIQNIELSDELKIYILYSLSILLKNYENTTIFNFDIFDVNKIFIKGNSENYSYENKNYKKEVNTLKCVNKPNSEVLKKKITSCLKLWENSINLFINNYDTCSIQDIIKVLNIFLILNHINDFIIYSIKSYIIINYKKINEHNSYSLMFYFQKLNVLNNDEDLIEILKYKIR
ncbi:conserved Plasmodium protein, unknown function [Plasmodium berghei]|uniref:Heptatricopeptide repeat-containing protein, putative n=2 Tax=Plasmodium berghei TaxID=5821 RepID=A0A509ALY0_PLABA|nr:heptatricopeptide repeat-containing protein, putative [Plasmodium berghei ANKA]CXI74546.1 conserved Plasmodium protein, unknown function [Plasmodium berghei]SCM24702.1 conserved Plasmodium protein, unknown function [Plasmodium berghei]SCN27144.1 conserved Plasmodium protein, unknown function [Plasmodium berghei]SCO61672.1 conserved Plasmodium protein, unknown function [Plasmodium berghei]SCO63567.1 conserved Plasmodium protein, unknown function [Plasmodium berghei]|eukprot:XP_034422778.1 heptatricopeptide repeat-containing protein, putative [Plasmodium berghei ANKA]